MSNIVYNKELNWIELNWSREVKLRIAHLELLHLKHVDMDWFPWVKFWKIKDKFSKNVLSSCKYFKRFELRNFGNVTTWIQEWSRASPKSSLFYNGGTQQSLRTDNLWPSNPERTGITANFMEGEESENLAKTPREGPRIINEGSENQTCTSMRDKRRPQTYSAQYPCYITDRSVVIAAMLCNTVKPLRGQ